MARQFGVDEAIPVVAGSNGHVDRLLALTAGRGVDVTIEATGVPAAVKDGIHMTRDGGRYVVVGHYTDHGEVGIDPHTEINRKHLEILGVWGVDFSHFHRMLRILDRHGAKVAGGKGWEHMVSRTYALDEINQALADVETGTIVKGRVRKDAIVVSIVAGVRLPILIEGLEHELVVRAMPTTPARVGMSATFWIPSSGAGGAPALERVRALFGALGTQVQVADEAAVESATGLAGPMPAFLLSLVEAFVDAGVALGLPREQAALATIESMRGSLELLRRTQESPATLREQVTSPGGATLAGLRVLESAGVRDAMMAAVRAVYERAQDLGRLPIAKGADH